MLGGNLTFAAAQWLVLVVLAKLLGVEAVGRFALGLAVAAPIFAFASLRLRAVQATDVRTAYPFPVYLGFTLLASLLALGVVVVLVAVSWRDVTGIVILLVAVAKGLEMISDIAQGLMQKHEAYRAIAASQIAKGVTGVSSIALGAILLGDVVSAAAGLAVARCACVLACDLPVARRLLRTHEGPQATLRPDFTPALMRAIFVLAFPIGLVLALNTLQLSLPRFAIARYLDEAAVGYYSAIAYVTVAAGMIVNALGQAALPRLSRHYPGAPREYLKLLVKLALVTAALGLAGVVVAALWGGPLLGFLYTPDYRAHGELFVWIMLGGAFQFLSATAGVGVTAARSFYSQVAVATPITLIVLIGCYALVPTHGLTGAAIAVAGAFAVKSLMQAAQIGRLFVTALRRRG
jgi:O-antigen/teichoic acid export membrane protein